MKIRMASALTKPVITERETKRISEPRRSSPATICSTPVSTVAASRYCRPCSLTSNTITSAIAPVAAEIMPGRPPGEGDDDGDAERGVQADLGVDTGNDREGDGLGDQGQCHDEAGEEIAADVGQPVPAQS